MYISEQNKKWSPVVDKGTNNFPPCKQHGCVRTCSCQKLSRNCGCEMCVWNLCQKKDVKEEEKRTGHITSLQNKVMALSSHRQLRRHCQARHRHKCHDHHEYCPSQQYQLNDGRAISNEPSSFLLNIEEKPRKTEKGKLVKQAIKKEKKKDDKKFSRELKMPNNKVAANNHQKILCLTLYHPYATVCCCC